MCTCVREHLRVCVFVRACVYNMCVRMTGGRGVGEGGEGRACKCACLCFTPVIRITQSSSINLDMKRDRKTARQTGTPREKSHSTRQLTRAHVHQKTSSVRAQIPGQAFTTITTTENIKYHERHPCILSERCRQSMADFQKHANGIYSS